MTLRTPKIPYAPRSIQKGTPLKVLLNQEAIECLAENILYVHQDFKSKSFCECALAALDTLELMQRGQHIAKALHQFLPSNYSEAIAILVASLTPEQADADEFGLAEFFYLPHSFFISEYGQDKKYNSGKDPFETSMWALHALTTRFTSEFAIRTFLIQQQERTLEQVNKWLNDPNPHVRRLCTEGTRPKLPWGKRIPSLIADPKPTLHILETLKSDKSLYVRRSVANHLGDIAKDHPEVVFTMCKRWLQAGASKELRWLIRHAVRHPAKKGDSRALQIRDAAK
ncbi:DNA alkylation repair protein [Alteromonas aestuariivivens]|uniref:DNA alkylation repair protein n=1 Tax=Alteromonas aestuariivivens TaxID=1938339 RepID=A0A3D8M9A2_9ALTE|nr:DNA alkylation repair protein [Alteromonas aestuariivivens]RDV26613.1 DNA alkylation repair protein [Alteromonas aestuariivivens]